MTAAEQPHFRYPGPKSFEDDDTDRHLFFGRDAEAIEVLNRLLSTRLLVLFAKSGLGKTSLLQAGVFPRLREHDFLPIRLRFNQPQRDFMAELQENVEKERRVQAIACTPGEGETLWEYFNTAIFSRGDRFLVPALVLDQFEEGVHAAGYRLPPTTGRGTGISAQRRHTARSAGAAPRWR